MQIDTDDLLAVIIVHRGLLRRGGRWLTPPREQRTLGDCHEERRPRSFIASATVHHSPTSENVNNRRTSDAVERS